MLAYPDMNDLVDRCGSAFTAIIIAAKRARKINDGEDEVLEEYQGAKDVSKALEEVVAGKLRPINEE
ncbi:DNA-directed RNA polymerase subunit omega [Halonatronum saccharophilum]|uniref:DNA-directed RNA polymerase subunit omega n=1 Tax=Halonatronum saccharophilum TaxID=150060 RepID=UPI000489A3A7|nr:DNA-directed RNA polymerase subunit omega [Halonatronum saccharophilum]